MFLEEIEDFFDVWGWLIVGDLENDVQADDEYVGQLFWG